MNEDVKTFTAFVALDSGQPFKEVLKFIKQAFKYRSISRLHGVGFTKKEIKWFLTKQNKQNENCDMQT